MTKITPRIRASNWEFSQIQLPWIQAVLITALLPSADPRDTSLDEAPCSLDNLGDLCDEPVAHHCVRVPAGSFNFRLCTVYCPGGTMLPLAKHFFYISKHSEVAATANPGQTEYQPVVETCLPLYACLNATGCWKLWQLCSEMFGSTASTGGIRLEGPKLLLGLLGQPCCYGSTIAKCKSHWMKWTKPNWPFQINYCTFFCIALKIPPREVHHFNSPWRALATPSASPVSSPDQS